MLLRLSRFTLALVALLLVMPPPGATHAQQGTETVVTAIAVQDFQHGHMIWREDPDKITVVYPQIRTKLDEPCSEIYRDTYDGQAYEIPPAPAPFTVPTLGFGWLYQNDPELARRLGYATGEEVSRVAEVTTTTDADGTRRVEIDLTELIGSVVGYSMSESQEPGLTYCFPRRNENRDELNTWVSRQLFEHGAMVWRQDMPDRVEVWHYDTEYAPELYCGDTLLDDWQPGMVLAYGEFAVPGKRLPQRGFGKVWLDRAYIRHSLGYPITEEEGGFASLSYEPFNHSTRGNLLVRSMTVQFADGREWPSKVTIPNATTPASDRILSTGCESILTPHQGTHPQR